jgi:hypothetical protein
VTEADATLLVADDNERGKAETLAALHNLGDAIDVNELIDEFAALAAISTTVTVATASATITITAAAATAAWLFLCLLTTGHRSKSF